MGDSSSTPDTQHGGDRRNLFWPGLVFVLLGGQVLFVLIMAYIATSDRSFAVEPDYYQKGLHWDRTTAQWQQNERLGWQAVLELGDDVDVLGHRSFRCILKDRDGQPLDGVFVDLIAFPHARGRELTHATLTESRPAVYTASLRFRRKGLWEFRLSARRDSDKFTYVEQRDVYPPGESRPWRR